MGVTYYMGVIFYIRLDDLYLKNVFYIVKLLIFSNFTENEATLY